MTETPHPDRRVADAMDSAGAEARLALYPVYPLLLIAGLVLLFSGNVATTIAGFVFAVGGVRGTIRLWRHRQLDMQISNTVRCPACGRRVAATAPICPRCETSL